MTRTLPDLSVDDFESPVDYIRAFYQELGWNPETQELEPRKKIKIRFDTWGEICMALKDKWGLMAALRWMNLGASGDGSNPFNLTEQRVKIVTGAMAEVIIE